MEFPRRICGGVRRVVVTEEQRYGPRRLRVNDDDDDATRLCRSMSSVRLSVCLSVCDVQVRMLF